MNLKKRIYTLGLLFKKLIKKPKSIFLILKDESEYQDYLTKKYGVTEFPTIDIDFFLHQHTATINNYTFLEGGSLLTDLALLKAIVADFDSCNYLEIGTWRGESIVNVADIPNTYCTSINLSPLQIMARGLPEKYAYEHGVLIKDRRNIRLIHADSLTYDFSELNQKFDVIFIDGDHSYEAVKSDTKNIFNLLRDENSKIIWHDYGFDPTTPRYSVISAILDGMPIEEHKHLYHVSNTMCAVFTREDVSNSILPGSNEKLNKTFQIKMTSSPFN